MTEADALIRACLAAPADQAPRLILADWLNERNDPRGPALRISHDLSFGGLPELESQRGYYGGSRPEHRLAARLALIACERRTQQWRIPDLYLTTCELAACRLIGSKRRDAWLRGPYVKTFGEWPVTRNNWGSDAGPNPYAFHSNAAALIMRACGYCQLPFDQLNRSDRPLAHRTLYTARHWIYTRMFEAVKDDRGTWYGYRRFVALPNGRRVHGDKKRGDVATGWQ